MPTLLSVLLVHWNTKDDLRESLGALHRHRFSRGSQEVIVVDNASDDGAAEMVRESFPEVRLIANPANELYARGVNQCADAATGDVLLLLNPDAQVQAGTLDTLISFLDSKPDAAAVAPKLVHEDGKVQASVRGFPSPVALLGEFLLLSRVWKSSRTWASWRMPTFDYGVPGEAPQPMASCFLIRREAWQTVGAMDERFPLYFNDADWCLRAYAAGYRIYYTPDTAAKHGYGGTTKRVRRAAVWESRRAMLRFLGKHYAGKTAMPLLLLLTIFITLDAWTRTGRWGQSLGKWGGETTPDSLCRELERERRSV
ncbi:MAG: glycosyltransferase family 2 protein [Akkermansiaceae bacterium]|nr:glycosyltransferase family 2 protein [Armatimonadota bacterium]